MNLKFNELFIKHGIFKRQLNKKAYLHLSTNNFGNLNYLIPLSQWVNRKRMARSHLIFFFKCYI
jgi:hypothetical protein